jgi:hypothetical protein
MAITELTTSRRIAYGSGQPVGVREYHVHPYPTEADVLALFAAGQLPNKLDAWPSAGYFTPAVDLRAFDYEIVRDPNVQEAWTVRITYREQGPDPLTPRLTPNEAGYISMRTSIEAQFEDAWRQWKSTDDLNGVSIPKLDDFFRPLYPIGTLDSDIGGIPIDVAGNPTSVMKHVQRIQLELVSPFRPSANIYRTYLGTRNLSTFLDCPRGTIVFTGVEGAISSPGKWSLTFNFDVDFFYHLKQVPKRHPNGSVVLDVADGEDAAPAHAKVVSWVQPFPIGTEFRNMTAFFASLP